MSYYHKQFSHIYIEKEAREYEVTRTILGRFTSSTVVDIDNYTDVFNPARQDMVAEKNSQSLILAVSHSSLVFKGAPVCQDFGYDHFYYTSNVMNCIYDCEYCYLQGMYNSAHVVVFVNIEDTLAEIERMLEAHPMYVCISYDTDLLPFESILGFTKRWIALASKHSSLTVECRTKSAAYSLLKGIAIPSNFIFAWTLSPAEVTAKYEHKTPSLESRVASICEAIDSGCTVRLCFDPMLHVENWQEIYGKMFDYVFSKVDPDKVKDFSLGTFRISKSYLENMRKKRPCEITYYPYEVDNGYYTYSKNINSDILAYAKEYLAQKDIDSSSIFTS